MEVAEGELFLSLPSPIIVQRTMQAGLPGSCRHDTHPGRAAAFFPSFLPQAPEPRLHTLRLLAKSAASTLYWETCSVKEKVLAAEASRGEGSIVLEISGGISGGKRETRMS